MNIRIRLPRMLLCLAVVFMASSAMAAASMEIRSADASRWPELRLEAKLPGELEKAADYEVNVNGKSVVAHSLSLLQKVGHADNLLIAVGYEPQPGQ